MDEDLKYMNIAIKEAKKSLKRNEVPIGCVIVKNNKIISKAHNLKESKQNALFHAEILAIFKASKKIKNWRLNDCTMYVTVKPCPMCSGAIKQSRIDKVIYGIDNENNKISDEILKKDLLNKNVIVKSNVCADKCKKMIQEFFKNKRI